MNETLLAAVQMKKIFPDGKTFVDCIPKFRADEIERKFTALKNKEGFDLKKFVEENFIAPVNHTSSFVPDTQKAVSENIERLWQYLTRKPDISNGTLIGLPNHYIVPGGRFGEIYYWDSYFTMLGLKENNRWDLIESMVKNFAYLLDTLGYIPNGNRTYFSGRSQPPFFAPMVELLAQNKGEVTYKTFLPQLEKEYDFWMKGRELLNEKQNTWARVVLMPDGEILNRYWDENNTPRLESYREDVELSEHSSQNKKELFRHLRAGAESGWDFSSRWFKNENDFGSIHTTDIIPIDLNCLLFNLENVLSKSYALTGNTSRSNFFIQLAENRKAALQKYCWNETANFYFDYDFVAARQKTIFSLAGLAPLFFKIASQVQANKVATIVEQRFLKPGGLVTSLVESGQQWDAPNGWAPLHWLSVVGLENYGFHKLAKEIVHRWLLLIEDVFRRTGKLMEKYNVINTTLEAGGGEYQGQDGFGWTNGVYLAMKKRFS